MSPHTDVSATVLITVDSLRADGVDLDRPATHTPTLASLADRATVFENAVALGNWTPFSFPSILGSTPVFADGPHVGVGRAPTLAERLHESGVSTTGVNAANGFLTEYWGYDRGFESFETFLAEPSNPVSRWLVAHPTAAAWVQFAAVPVRGLVSGQSGPVNEAHNAARMADLERRAVETIETADAPFFLWVHYMDTHTPYVPAPKHVRAVSDGDVGTLGMLRAHFRTGFGRAVGEDTLSKLRTLYAATARQVDASVGRLLSALEERGIRDDTAVIVAGDHGEEFQEHGHLAHYPKLYDELTHVPLLVDLPGGPGRRVEAAVGLDAVPPTVCEAMGVTPPTVATGESLVPTVLDGTAPDDDPVTSIAVRGDSVTQQPIPRRRDDGDPLVSARTADWAYVRYTATGEEELYDRSEPLGERENRIEPPGAAPLGALRRAADRRLDRTRRDPEDTDGGHGGRSADGEDPPDDLEDRLAALGYR